MHHIFSIDFNESLGDYIPFKSPSETEEEKETNQTCRRR